jgi:predicted aminopeptidase
MAARVRSKSRRAGRRVLLLMAVGAVALVAGCETCSFYRQAIVGQYRIVAARRPIDKVLADPQTSTNLSQKLRLVLRLREFAEKDLKLPANGHYLRYADVGRRYVVWNVHAAPPFSLEAKTWWYPFVGSLEYRGYFAEKDARRYGGKLEHKGLDVYVEGVEAYSTLGWFRDPVLNTFIHHDEAELAETIFHELAHQKVFVGGDTDFDEAFATAVGQEATRCWLLASGDTNALESYGARQRREVQFVQLVTMSRQKLEAVFTNSPCSEKSRQLAPLSPPACQQAKQQITAQLRRDYGALKALWGGFAGYDPWFEQPLNNAQLNTIATYYDWVPAFQRLLRDSGDDLERFYAAVKALAKRPKKERARRLTELLQNIAIEPLAT